jgi:hypothetical protein
MIAYSCCYYEMTKSTMWAGILGETMISSLPGIPDTDGDGHGATLSMLDLGLCDVVDVDIGVVN